MILRTIVTYSFCACSGAPSSVCENPEALTRSLPQRDRNSPRAFILKTAPAVLSAFSGGHRGEVAAVPAAVLLRWPLFRAVCRADGLAAPPGCSWQERTGNRAVFQPAELNALRQPVNRLSCILVCEEAAGRQAVRSGGGRGE
ncbi:hypothetical protein MHYP_G00312760 [Metynnis hypsauchen]